MSLLAITPRLVSQKCITRIMAIRCASKGLKLEGKQSLTVDPSVQGFFKYERDISRDKRYINPQKLGDTPMRFLVRKLGHAYELYPIFFLTGVWFIMFCYVIYYSFEKMEIWLDRSKSTAPWDWERIRNNYWKKPTLLFDTQGVTRQRLEILEVLQDEMVEAAKARGTR
ncbi:unnamed protein product [Nippostrongylus brasiliensis]|uniref:NADH dehydrogenase [ubiquinone] 1 beta subcomplex subunit 11, mitochondrial n=1 Tax=Nippostrongylus brasiliensis TaxID=27835 RepID=A0A0N4XXN3_NIPBR|nr:hypothetical protein Q1695_009351 [Nippostrongylus brasiliensis]VDL71357.1 unnamed protein product [Nippostrongylus brasiliensis]